MKNKKLGLLVVSLFVSIVLFGQNIEQKIDEIAQSKISDNDPGIAIIVKEKGEIIYHKAFGKADVELGVDMITDNVFRIGSITKQFTACAILKLAEENKLSLDDKIQKYLPDYPTQGKTITIEHLLTHTSGIKTYTGMPEWTEEVRKKHFDPQDLIEYFKKDELNFDPGEKFAYNNTAYFILGYIIEEVSGDTYEDYIENTFFKALGMKNSYYGSSTEIIPNRASGYAKNGNRLSNAEYLSMTQPYSAGSLLSTVEDLSIWNEAVFSNKVINKESLKKAHTTFVLNDGESTKYGYGWFIGERFEKPTIEHGGGINGFATTGVYFPDEDLFIAIFSNCTCFNPGRIVGKVAEAALNIDAEKKEIKLSADKMKKFVGEYELIKERL